MISLTCQNRRTEERIYPMSPIIQVKAVASIMMAYWERTEIFPHSIGLLIYFAFSISDPQAKKRAMFKTTIGIVAAVMAFMAIANYQLNFYGNSRLLPVSLVMVTALAFMMGIYFTNISALLKIGGFMFFVAAGLSGYGNWLPQVEGGFPPPEVKLSFGDLTPEQLADEGEKLIFGGLGQSSVQGSIGKGQCPLCHGISSLGIPLAVACLV